MAIEIRELTIKTTVVSASSNQNSAFVYDNESIEIARLKKSIINECLEQLEERLENRFER